MHITMLGVGNGFSDGVLNNNALVECGGDKALIDCGITAWDGLARIGIRLNEIQRIFLTHIHFDHAGGLEQVAMFTKYMGGKRIELIVPSPIREELWDRALCGALENAQPNTASLDDFFDVVSPCEGEAFALCNDVRAKWMRTNHVPGKFSCGLLIADKLFYTSDMLPNAALLQLAYEGGARVFFHDCALNGSPVHAALADIKQYPEHIRKNMFLMHHGLLAPPARREGMRFLRQGERLHIPLAELNEEPIHVYRAEEDELVQKTIDYMRKRQTGEKTGHDFAHTERVYKMALRLGFASEKPVDMRIIALGALLHDIDDWKFNDGNESAGPRAAGEWLRENGFAQSGIEHIKSIIHDLSYKGSKQRSRMNTPEGEIVQDADRLDALGAIGVARAFATGVALGNGIFDPHLPPRTAMDSAQYKDRTVQATTVNHFYEKLLLLKNLMNTPMAKAIAQERHRFMVEYLKQLYAECDVVNGVHDALLQDIENNSHKEGDVS